MDELQKDDCYGLRSITKHIRFETTMFCNDFVFAPGSCTLPFPGIMAAVVDEASHDVEWGKGGFLVIKRPWPAMIRTIWGDPERYKKSYYPEELGGKLYLAGDGSVRDPNTGYFTIMGRIDDVLNVS
ncbi:MAG: AMP-binding protein, partial [Sulfuricellaceae bacterium]|nr:AMP-binding protein [Sulfuricellaceae bacterium]